MKSPFLIDLCIISDKSLSSSDPPYLGYFLSPLVPHCPLTTSGPDASTSNCFPKDAPSTCLLPIVHLLLQQFHILPSVNIWDCARHMSAFLQCAFISHSLTTVTLFPRIIRIRVHQLWNVHILPRMFSALFSSHSSTALRSHTVRLFLPFAELLRSPRATVSRARNVTSPPDIFTSVTSDMWQMPPKPDIFMWKLDSVWNVTPDLIFSHPENQCQHHNVPLLTFTVLDWTYQY